MGYGLPAAVIAAEVAGTTAMKYSDGSSRLWPSLATVAGCLVDVRAPQAHALLALFREAAP